jgi:hypothetical protein
MFMIKVDWNDDMDGGCSRQARYCMNRRPDIGSIRLVFVCRCRCGFIRAMGINPHLQRTEFFLDRLDRRFVDVNLHLKTFRQSCLFQNDISHMSRCQGNRNGKRFVCDQAIPYFVTTFALPGNSAT